ncbi:class I SAM-dependent DNA methyltransferase [Pseudomonas aeruginosa]|nr:class I SAM-dependent DNA methyltransferase [Pseudomonas aeruginosa]MBN0087446.1 class I SAM-dependent DNA methyltransferase [Pseudomonas aeruginosa]MBN0146774.1 class I SAM-dependent DNA methyltransferase [Pseudomonas aeruginosa]MBN0296990.1 class I SAM-dependent DNA methyltransferase [Pseudomonas aeruginosa]MBN0317691.1 class I SAM-dependent DNA methyltransferase [Pseudomonas aeruginosa]
MNAVEIESAVSDLALQPFDGTEFPFAFLQAFGNKETTIKRLRSGASNKSDLGGVLQTNNIHIAVAQPGEVTKTLAALKASSATTRAKARFILATDGEGFEAEDMETGETVACTYQQFPDHFGFFLPLAGITTVKQVRDSSFDIRATSRLNRLYVELLKDNPDWGAAAQRHEMNHFMARLIFCFFAEDTDIFNGEGLFTATIEQMSARDSSNTHEVISEIFRAMNTKIADRANAKLPRWADGFPYVNGGLFSGSVDVPRFSKIARSYLLHIGSLDWTKINPDIFGSMIQAVADDEERGELGMHYTSMPNILKVLNPLFLDDLRMKLEEAGDNPRTLLNLRKRLARIRVFDPACGSGNFLVIAYKQMREIENTINERRGERGRKSDIPLTNFRGIELRDFSAEIARLALIIAEYQCDVLYRGQKEALLEFLPLSNQNWITCGNALQLDWLSVCPPTGTGVKLHADDLFETPLNQAQIDFENEGGETYICGNPPYLGSRDQKDEHKAELQAIFEKRVQNWKSLDYVAAWFMKAADYGINTQSTAAFVSTNSICQGLQVPILWPEIFASGCQIEFAHTSFRWANLASNNAGVTVVIIGITRQPRNPRRLFSLDDSGQTIERQCSHINAYLAAGESAIVDKASQPLGVQSVMTFGNTPIDGGHLLLSRDERDALQLTPAQNNLFVRRIYGSAELIRGLERYCLWIEDKNLAEALAIRPIAQRIHNVRSLRLNGGKTARDIAEKSHQFQRMFFGKHSTIIVPSVSSESRKYLPCSYEPAGTIVSNLAFALYDAPLWNLALIASRLHLVWIATVCGKLKTDFRYSNTLGWNTFPIPTLTEKNKGDLTRCAEEILLAREAHFPATIAELYDPEKMPDNLRAAHERNDEVLERIYIGRRFKNDTERLEKLFELYTKMIAVSGKTPKAKKAATA